MKFKLLASAIALSVLFSGMAALADDPNDPTMRTAAARARDRAIIRQLNLAELRKVRARDARLAKQWRAWREWQEDHGRDR